MVSGSVVNRAFRYRFHPTPAREVESALLTEWKKTDGLAFLNEVSSVPLQQSLRHLQSAFTAFREKRARYPRFKSRKQKGSANGAKARLRVARVHARIADRRRDLLHELTTRLVREIQLVVIEDLAVRDMLRNRSSARVISDAGWSDPRSMLEYKCHWYGRDLVVVDRRLPSSKTCSACGRLRAHLPLHVRVRTCECGARHDRDVNVARNILAAGPAVTACGDGVRPTRR